MSPLKRIALVLAGITALAIASYGFMTSPGPQAPTRSSVDLLMIVGLANLWLGGGVMIGAGLFGKRPIIGGAVGFVIVVIVAVRFVAAIGGMD